MRIRLTHNTQSCVWSRNFYTTRMGSPSFSSYFSLLLVLVLSLSLLSTMSSVRAFVSVSSFVYVRGHRHAQRRTQAQALPRWRGPFPFSASPLSCCAVRSEAGVGIGQEEQEEKYEFAFPPAGIDVFKLEKEEIVVLAKFCYQVLKERAEKEKERAEKEKERAEKEKQRAETEKERAEKEKQRAETERQRRLRVEDSRRTERTKALQDAAGLHVRGLLETAERNIKKWVQEETGKLGKGRREWWMTFARDVEEGRSFVACLRRKELLENVEDAAQVGSVVAETIVGIFRRINTLLHPPVRGLAAVSIVEGPLTPKECLYLECIASELEDVNVEIIWKQKRGDERELE